jgi:hypothetical protein
MNKNNTTTTPTIVAILMIATLIVGTLVSTTTIATQSAAAYGGTKKVGLQDKDNGNSKMVTQLSHR